MQKLFEDLRKEIKIFKEHKKGDEKGECHRQILLCHQETKHFLSPSVSLAPSLFLTFKRVGGSHL